MDRDLREVHRLGRDYLRDVTALLQRNRRAHPTAGLYEAADLQWWWRNQRSTDHLPQLFWLDGDGHPVAAVIATDWGDRVGLDVMVLPDSPPDWIDHVVDRGVAHARDVGLTGQLSLEVDPSNDALQMALTRHGFTPTDDGIVESWLRADDRPPISPLSTDYRLATRAATSDRVHHMVSEARGHTDPEPRLRQTSLYRSDLDLVVLTDDDSVAAYGLFWFDPSTATGLVEPMRTEDAHQRHGLARHILTVGLDRLAEVGAERVKICFEPDNPASRHLYLSVGFQPHRQTRFYERARTPASG